MVIRIVRKLARSGLEWKSERTGCFHAYVCWVWLQFLLLLALGWMGAVGGPES